MANKDLKSLRFPGLPNRYVIDGLSDDAKEKLLTCFSHVTWTDEHGQEYVNDLENALYQVTLVGITAAFAQGSAVIYDTDAMDDLKPYLTVTAEYSNGTATEVTTYTLSGTLSAGTSVITVSYGGYDATFNVTVTHQVGYYSVTNNLTGATSSNSATSVEENTAYSATITADSGYTLTGATVSVTMGGTDITSSAYSNGTISIASVTGDIAITVVAAEEAWGTVEMNSAYSYGGGQAYSDGGETALNTANSKMTSASPINSTGVVRIRVTNDSGAALYAGPYIGLSDAPVTEDGQVPTITYARLYNTSETSSGRTDQWGNGVSLDITYNVEDAGKYLIIYSTGNYKDKYNALTWAVQFEEA